MKLGPALKLKAILSSRIGVQCQKCGGQNAAITASAVSPSPSPASVNGSESRRLSQSATTGGGANGRRSESPQVKLPMSNDSFGSFRTKLESMSPNYSSGGEATTTCEGMIATVTMTTAAPDGRSTPKDLREEASPNGKDIPMISAADR